MTLVDRDVVTQEVTRTPKPTVAVNTFIGPMALCTGYGPSVGTFVPPSCDPSAQPTMLDSGGVDIDVLTSITLVVTQTITNTDTYRTAEEYLLTASAAPADTAQVPTLSEWGLLALALGLAGAGFWRLRAGGLACLLLTLLAGAATAPRVSAQTITLASRAAPGFVDDAAGGMSVPIGTSSDGRYILFRSYAINLVPGQVDRNGGDDLFLHDRTAGTIVLVSHAAGSLVDAANVRTSTGVLSADGRYVAFLSFATDLVAGYVESVPSCSTLRGTFFRGTAGQLYLFDRDNPGSTVLVSHKAGSPLTPGISGGGYLGGGRFPQISGNGAYVAYFSSAIDLVPSQSGQDGIFLYERATGMNTLVSRKVGTTSQVAANGYGWLYEAQGQPPTIDAISTDGQWVVHSSDSTELVPGQVDVAGTTDLFLFDRSTGANVLVSHAAGLPAIAGAARSDGTAISADGRFVAFTTLDSSLVAAETNPQYTLGVYLFDRTAGANTLLSRSTAGALVRADADSFHPLLSADGTTIAFASYADDLDPLVLDANGFRDVYLYTRP